MRILLEGKKKFLQFSRNIRRKEAIPVSCADIAMRLGVDGVLGLSGTLKRRGSQPAWRGSSASQGSLLLISEAPTQVTMLAHQSVVLAPLPKLSLFLDTESHYIVQPV